MTNETLLKSLFLGDEVKGSETLEAVRDLILTDEEVAFSTKGVRDGGVFTNRRIIVVNKQGIMGKKIDITSFPLRSITCFSIENSGTFDLDAEVKIWGSGWGRAEMKFTKGFDVTKVALYLARTI